MERLPSWAADYVGLPFKAFGRDRGGLDCWGLARLIQKEQFGRDFPSYAESYAGTDFQSGPQIAGLIENALPAFRRIQTGAEICGDLIGLREGKLPHIGTVLGMGQMLHIQRGPDSVIECYRSHLWRHRIFGIYRPI